MIQINLPNKERLLLVEVPEGATGWKIYDSGIRKSISFRKDEFTLSNVKVCSSSETPSILGLFYPSRNEIDFEVMESWVKRVNGVEGVYWNYQNPPHRSVGATLRSYKESFLSLLQSRLPDYLQSITTEETSNIRTVNLAKHNEYVNKKYLVLIQK